MSTEPLYHLSDHVVVEPLIDKWIAWPHNFSPVLYGLHLLNYQKEVLSSYLRNPSVHVRSSRNPKLLGGPFVDIEENRASEVKDLLTTIEQSRADLLKLASDLTEFQNMLMQTATGQSVETYYEQLPDSIRGFVELGYDYHNHPVVRCIESLFYESSYFKRNSQSIRIFSLENDDSRPYYMSTPRLANSNDIEWNISFDSTQIDELFKLDICPQSLDYICNLLGLTLYQDTSRLLPLLSSNPYTPTEPWSGDGLRLRYFGHACVLLEGKGVSILTDPFVSTIPKQAGIDRLTFKDLPAQIDYVLITHGHHDHFVFESLLRLRHRIDTLVVPRSSGVFHGDLSLKQIAQKLGFKRVQEVDTLESISFSGGKITSIPFFGEHCDLLHAKSGYVVSLGEEQVLFAADSCCLDKRVYENVKNIVGPISTVFIGMECIGAPLSWVYAPLLPIKPERSHDQSRRSHANDAVSAFNLLQAVGARRAYVYALGREPWLKYFMALTPADDDLYMQEVRKLFKMTQTSGFLDTQMLYGKKDLYLESGRS